MSTRSTVTFKFELVPGALERLRDLAIAHTPLNLMAARYVIAQVQLAGGTPYDAWHIACWLAYPRLTGVYDALLELWDELGGEA